jgi:hypothetical protein
MSDMKLTGKQYDSMSGNLGFVQGVLGLLFSATESHAQFEEIKGLGWVISEAEDRIRKAISCLDQVGGQDRSLGPT